MQRSKTFKICGLILFVFMGMNAFSQNNTTSPFSRFGIGDVANLAKGRAAGMGGVGISLNSPYALNSLNPAACAALDSMSFVFEGGINSHFSTFKANGLTHNTKDTNFDYFAMAFPVTSWWRASMGLNPYSNIGYNMKTVVGGNQQYSLEGKGGINKAYISSSFIPVKNLYLGINLSYMFGQIDRSQSITFVGTGGESLPGYINLKMQELMTVKEIMLDFGMQYKRQLNEDYSLSLGAIYAPKKTFNASSTESISGSTIVNTTKDIEIPTKLGAGFALQFNDNMTLGLDYTNDLWSDVKALDDESFKNNESYALGFEIVPNKRSMRSYLAVVAYRVGAHYTDSYVKIDGNSIKDYGVSFGFGFPLRRSSTYINLAFDFGKRGSIATTKLEENYAKISLSFSMFSNWFYKQKYE